MASMNCEVALAFCDLVGKLWNGSKEMIRPTILRLAVCRKSDMYNNQGQHDSMGFLAFLLDQISEDLNRVKEKTPI